VTGRSMAKVLELALIANARAAMLNSAVIFAPFEIRNLRLWIFRGQFAL
jgi:hypothetical protein